MRYKLLNANQPTHINLNYLSAASIELVVIFSMLDI